MTEPLCGEHVDSPRVLRCGGGYSILFRPPFRASRHGGRRCSRVAPDLSFYCRDDILTLARRLTEAGHLIVLNFQRGMTPADMHVDVAPFHYGRSLLAHHRSHVITSIGLVIQKNGLAP